MLGGRKRETWFGDNGCHVEALTPAPVCQAMTRHPLRDTLRATHTNMRHSTNLEGGAVAIPGQPEGLQQGGASHKLCPLALVAQAPIRRPAPGCRPHPTRGHA